MASTQTIEIWTLYAVAVSATFLRTYARIRAVSIKGLRADDYLIWVGIVSRYKNRFVPSTALTSQVFYTIQSSLGYGIGYAAHGMANNSMTDEQRAALSPSDTEYQLRVVGSKIQVAGWAIYSTLITFLKLSMLAFFIRLTVRLIPCSAQQGGEC
jgi:hypothetical protein